jgi:Class III cytochrome C family
MKILYGIIAFIFCSAMILAQNKNVEHSDIQVGTCKACHSCDVPTKQNPCLNVCPRDEMVTIDEPPEKGPNIVKLNELSNEYLPVVFNHKAHAQMSLIHGGCGNCHHHNAIGSIQSCSNCHSVKRTRTDLSKPDLEAAYHRQCMGCHRAWSHSNDCTSCHAMKTGEGQNINDHTGLKDHPNVVEPDRIIFETNYQKGKLVTFFHQEHISLFGIKCKSCHQNDNCTSCHDKLKYNKAILLQYNQPIKLNEPESERHKPCFSCHQDDNCTLCHKDNISHPFNHFEVTGWALNKFHEKLTCEKCHGTANKFVKLDNSCTSCHKNFKQDSFDHKIAGFQLDENHSILDCSDCHPEKDFSIKPDCSSCHADKSFPKDKPGKLIKISSK